MQGSRWCHRADGTHSPPTWWFRNCSPNPSFADDPILVGFCIDKPGYCRNLIVHPRLSGGGGVSSSDTRHADDALPVLNTAQPSHFFQHAFSVPAVAAALRVYVAEQSHRRCLAAEVRRAAAPADDVAVTRVSPTSWPVEPTNRVCSSWSRCTEYAPEL